MKKVVSLAFVLVLLSFSMLGTRLVITVIGSTTHDVHPDQSIQEAINSAQSGDTIFVHSGTYYEHMVVSKSISLIGENRDTTIVDGNKAVNVIDVKADNVTISGFTIQNGERGIWIWNCNSVNVTDNIVSHNQYGMWLDTSNYSIIIGNVITSNNGIGVFWWKNNGTIILNNTISDNALDGVSMRYVTYSIVRENTITANNQNGVGLHYSSGNIIIKNIISNNFDGIYPFYSNGNIISGNHIEANDESGIFLDVAFNNSISGNQIKANDESGIYLCESSNNIIYHNNFVNNTQQVYDDSWYFPDVSPSVNIWDDGYPSGGNYWSDYEEMYPDAEELDDSGIWDTPYVIDADNIDHYPLMKPWGAPPSPSYILTVDGLPTGITFTIDGVPQTTPYTEWLLEGSYTLVLPETHDGYVWSHWLEDGDTSRIKTVTMDTNITLTAVFTLDNASPIISIVSPENKTYHVKDVPLTFIVSESTSWIGYSLDGQMNTISGNTTIVGLSDRAHTITVYANDTAGNTGASGIICFSIKTQKAEPLTTLTVAAIAITATVGAALLVYFAKVKKTTEKVK